VPVMAASGFIMLYPVLVTKILPGCVVPVALTAHSHEALLALWWIFLVHIFFNHFSPGVFPLNKSIFTGRVPEERYQREHPLEYQRIQNQQREQSESTSPALTEKS
jgi:cytochrome b subunit of formate dehydrogenase